MVYDFMAMFKVKCTVAFVLLCGLGLFACNSQEGYSHTHIAFNDDDRAAIAKVQKSVLGRPETMRQVVSEIIDDSKPLDSCNYFVSKIIDTDSPKGSDGLYPVHYLVQCNTILADGSGFWFTWTVRVGAVRTFEWHPEIED